MKLLTASEAREMVKRILMMMRLKRLMLRLRKHVM